MSKKEKSTVITRFPPEPSGYLHIGHLKAIYHNLNKGSSTLLRFDDTNPTTSSQHYVDHIIEVLNQYGLLHYFSNWDSPSYASNYFNDLLNYQEQMIKQGDAYIDQLPHAEMIQLRHDSQPSPFRDVSIEDNLEKWAKFVNGDLPDAVVRLKISYNNANAALRDPVSYRTNITDSHYRTGRKFNVYPTYDFACPIIDSLDGITLAQRTNEFTDKNDVMKWVFKTLPHLKSVKYQSYSRLVFEYSILSKRKIRELTINGMVDGWDDPRLDTLVAGLSKGILPDTWKEFFTKHGVSNSNNVEDWDKLYNINRRLIDNISKRIMALGTDVWSLQITDEPSLKHTSKQVNWSPKDKTGEKMGYKTILLSDNLKIDALDAKLIKDGDLIYLLNFKAVQVTCIDVDAKIIKTVAYNEEFEFKNIPHIISWLTDDEYTKHIPIITTYYDYILTKQYLTKDDNTDDYLNPHTKTELKLHLSANQNVLQKGMIIQLVRFGFYIVNSIEPLNLIYIREPGNKHQYLLDGRIKFE